MNSTQWRNVILFDVNGNPVAFGSGGTASADGTPFVAGSTLGTPMLAEDPTSGNLLVPQLSPGTRQLSVAGTFTSSPPASSTVSAPSQPVIGAVTSVQLLAANAARKRMRLQNIGTTVMYILFGAGSATAANCHIVLPAGGTSEDGSSSIITDDMWQGRVAALSSAAGGIVSVAEFT